ncbi:WD40 repeat domain-containing protein [Streptomyces sp. TRM64462]|uniref:WD40 repeat domain-containing protein n=1 Tax=Streptomyces sp. TRM64462 TaxID=2741726 RepID=UPI001586E2C8|nr:hypothetical protein [Streptomyces sp. TRM64462]
MWEAANQLGVAAGTPAELLTALLSAPRRGARVELSGDDPETAELARDLRTLLHLEVTLHPLPAPEPGDIDLSDPEAVCAADPVRVTRAYEASPGDHGGLREAWLRAGQALVRHGQHPAGRALALLAALPEGADPRLAPALAARAEAEGTPWEVTGTRRASASVLTTCGDRLVVDEDPRVRAVACLADGDTELRLDERGRLRPTGPVPRLVRAVAATLATHPASALAAAGDTVVTGDRMGSLHAFSLAGLHQSAAHSGRVTALAAAGPGPRVYSGGVDGTVRTWDPPRGAPAGRPLVRRGCPVVAVHAGPGGVAVAWADGLAELHRPGAAEPLTFRPGPPLRALALHPDGTLTVATPETLIHLRPA